MAVVLALGAAIGWGASDYFGGDASRRDTSVFAVVALAELIGVVALVPVLIAHGGSAPTNPRLLLAAVAGIAVTGELSLIYRALSRGLAFITAPTGALGTAAAVTIGLIGGNPLTLPLAMGLLCALVGSAISAWTSPSGGTGAGDAWHAAAICIAAAAAVGTMLTTLHAAGRLDPYWATGTEHAATGLSAGLSALIARRRRSALRILPHPPELPRLGLIAAVGLGGDLAYASAAHHGGSLAVVSALAALYPLTTLVLGSLLRGQHATTIQRLGIILALGGGALLAASAS